MDKGIYPVVRLYDMSYSGKLLREKTFANFAVLWLFAKVFSAKIGGVAPLVLQSAQVFSAKIVFFTNPRKFSPSKVSCYAVLYIRVYYDVHSLLYSLFSAHQEQAPRRSYEQTETVGDKRLQTNTL